MKRLYLVLLVFILPAASVSAQTGSDCGHGLPCGPIPWSLPGLPLLPSPTPLAPVDYQPSPGDPTPAPVQPTSTPIMLPTTGFENDNRIMEQIATMEALLNATPLALDDRGISQYEMEGNISLFFGYILGLGDLSLGVFTPLISFLLFSFLFVLILKATTLIIPVVAAIFGLIRKLVDLILQFIPL